MINLNVNTKERKSSYPVFIDDSDITELKDKITSFLAGKSYVVVISKKVDKLYKKQLGFDKKDKFILKDGEKEKNFDTYKKIIDFCHKKNLTRDGVIIAIGGGVAGDIAGFVAATYMRGIDFIQVPTTLLACVDSSVGGKTAINTEVGKNLAGAFHQPKAVFINTNFLKTLSLREFKTGLGEVVKYAFIEKSCMYRERFNLLEYLSQNAEAILNYENLEELIRMCLLLKISIVERDEKETGLRRILNLGHTYGHAVEVLTKYKKYTHGECVIVGICFAFVMALKNRLIEDDYFYLMEELIRKFNFKQVHSFKPRKYLPILKTDKKATADFIRLILPTGYGQVNEYLFSDTLEMFL